jgi:ribose transport system ATP-binding protein
MPNDRHREGLMMTLSVRENSAISSLTRFKSGPLLSRKKELDLVYRELDSLAVKAPSVDADISALSGGNQQKVVMARSLLSQPTMILADEPTQGVDVGARAEIYRILRDISETGVPVVVASSDALELAGLCDRVIVMSRGNAVETLTGSDVSEEKIVHAAVRATAHKATDKSTATSSHRSSRIQRFMRGDYAPVVILAIVMVALGAYIFAKNDRYFNAFNVSSVMLLSAALGFIAMGQTIALLVGGIDLSVGPLAGFMVIIASFFVNDGKSIFLIVLGLVLMFVSGGAVGAINGSLIRYAKFTPVAATLTMYIALQGLSFLLRDTPGGIMNANVTSLIQKKIGIIPIAFIVLVVAVFAMEFVLRYRPWGLRTRAVGSNEEAARRVGVRVNRTVIFAYMCVGFFVFLGAIILVAQLGIGDPAQGISYTLTSITAVVLGGTSLLGGRGTFIGTLLGTGLIVQMLNATTFLGLSQTWQYIFQGGFIVIAAVIYSQIRGFGRAQD